MIVKLKEIKIDENNIEEILEGLDESMKYICAKNKKFKKHKVQLDAIWWNPTLEIKRSRVRALRRRFQATREQNERLQRKIKYKMEYGEYKLMIKKAKRECMIEFLEKIAQKNSMGVIKNILKDKRLGIKMALIVQDNGELTRDFADSRDYVLKKHFPRVEEDIRVERYRNRGDDIKDFTIE
ncbi:hypothetical protein AVEN_147612-1 [Araneus ventricosus]|uniref:Uncharacterized protein n=1 Tax=Araneus ventricosus TaxID=182803 RepID=A0A4Y2H308_ARAVE|nr:hypothetical protein AVEN_147612-1 [Araneus ventricosus]